MKTLFVIPARGGSKGIPGKNIKPLAGKPLIGYSIEVARARASLKMTRRINLPCARLQNITVPQTTTKSGLYTHSLSSLTLRKQTLQKHLQSITNLPVIWKQQRNTTRKQSIIKKHTIIYRKVSHTILTKDLSFI